MGYCISRSASSLITLTTATTKTRTSLSYSKPTYNNPLNFPYTSNFSAHRAFASVKRNDVAPVAKKGNKVAKRLIRISTAEGRWNGDWNTDYTFSLRDLHLHDLVEDDGDPRHQQVSISLSVQKHAGFGLSVDGTIATSFTRKCCNCSSPYCRQMNTKFNVWVLPKDNDANGLPEIGSDDPSVIYVKPGGEADLDSLVQDTIRLTSSVNETCSEFCEKSEIGLQHLTKHKAPSIDRRWSKLLELKNLYQ